MTVDRGEEHLVEALHQDDADALVELFDRYGDRIYNHCFRATGDWSDAEDAVASVFLEVWRHRRRVRIHDGSALPWLYGVATNVCRNLTRSRRRRHRALASLPRPSTEPDHAERVSEQVSSATRMQEVLAAVAALPRHEREVLGLVAWSGLTYEQAAAALSTSPSGLSAPGSLAPGLAWLTLRLETTMPDLTPPPDQPLPPHARNRIRAELVSHPQKEPGGPRRWLIPAVAAASVGLVAVMAAWAVQLGSGSGGSDGAPTTQSSSPVASGTPSEEPTEVTDEPTEVTDEPTPNPTETVQVGTRDCVTEMQHVLKGAEEAVSFQEDDGGPTSYWVKGDQFVLCDVRAGRTSVHKALPMTPRPDEVSTFRVSTRLEPLEGGAFRSTWVAGGIVPTGALAYDIAYRFPYDGHVERATTVTDDQGRTWWRMVYAFEGRGDYDSPPISVTVSLSGVRHVHELEWGTDTCAQANHGC